MFFPKLIPSKLISSHHTPRCHLASGNFPKQPFPNGNRLRYFKNILPALLGIPSYSRQLTCALRRRILGIPAFDCALRGPFDKLRPTGSQHSRLSVSATSAVISTSTVFTLCGLVFFLLVIILAPDWVGVNIFLSGNGTERKSQEWSALPGLPLLPRAYPAGGCSKPVSKNGGISYCSQTAVYDRIRRRCLTNEVRSLAA